MRPIFHLSLVDFLLNLTLWIGSFQYIYKECLVSFRVAMFIEIAFLNANSGDPDHRPCSVASDLGLHCLLTSLLWDTRHK